jgi:hypothetical protein
MTERTLHMKTWLKKSYIMLNMLLVHTYSCQSGLINNHTLLVSLSKTSKSKKVISFSKWPSNMPIKKMAIMVLSRFASQNSFKTLLNFRLNLLQFQSMISKENLYVSTGRCLITLILKVNFGLIQITLKCRDAITQITSRLVMRLSI